MDRTFTVMVFNADGSNRHPDINSVETLTTFLHDKIQLYSSEVEPLLPRAGVSAQGSSNVPADDENLRRCVAALTLAESENPLVATSENPLPTTPAADSSVTDTAPQSPGASNVPADAEIIGEGPESLMQSPTDETHLEVTPENPLPTTPSSDSSVTDTAPQSHFSSTSLPPSLPTSPMLNGLVTVSEIKQSALTMLREKLKKGATYVAISTPNNYLATYWNADKWKYIPYDTSLHGQRYYAVFLEHKVIKKRLLYVSVHLPHKDKERQKIELEEIKKLIEDNKQRYPAWIIAGDFNMTPTGIKQVFGSDMTPAIGLSDDKEPTTRAGSSIDNILMSDAIELLSPVTIDSNEKLLSHHPLYGVLRFKDI